jgi:DNA-3-methyladenine glycosylase
LSAARAGAAAGLDPRERAFYDRSVHDVARDLVGCVLRHGAAAGRIVEVESYHMEEPACHAYAGLTPRTATLFGPPGLAYVYRSYGIHALLNAVAEPEGVGAAALIRALEPLDGVDAMRARRGLERVEDLCSGPGKLTQALGIGLDLNGTPLGGGGPIELLPPDAGARPVRVVRGERIGITKAVDLPWRFCDASSRCVSRPWPAAMRRRAAA